MRAPIDPGTTAKGGLPLSVVGVHSTHEGYPNVRFRLADLDRSLRYRVTHLHRPWLERLALGGRSRSTRARAAAAFLVAHLRLWSRLLGSPSSPLCYVPYPAVLVCLTLRLLPRSRKPQRLVVDAFIGVHDTIVNDRRLLGARNPLARALWRLERLAYRQADAVVVDTDLNRSFMAEHYRLPEGLFHAVPLSTDERAFRPSPLPRQRPLTVLFVGTLIPLHGVPRIIDAVERLRGRDDIRFEIVGDGQMRDLVERAASDRANRLHWHRDWLDGEALGRRIARADICLGVFGDTDKTGRVCPLKLYAYLACGRPVVTARTPWTDSVLERIGRLPFEAVETAVDPAALARRIAALADDPARRAELAAGAARFYRDRLSNERAARRLDAVFDSVLADAGRVCPRAS